MIANEDLRERVDDGIRKPARRLNAGLMVVVVIVIAWAAAILSGAFGHVAGGPAFAALSVPAFALVVIGSCAFFIIDGRMARRELLSLAEREAGEIRALTVQAEASVKRADERAQSRAVKTRGTQEGLAAKLS